MAVALEEVKSYFDVKFKQLQDSSTAIMEEVEENNRKRDANLVERIKGFTS